VIATASTQNQELLRELGADETIDYTRQRFEDVARNVDIVLDPIGGDTQERSWQVLKKGGALLSIVQPPSAEKAKELGVRAAFVASHPNGAELAKIAELISTPAISSRSSIGSCRCQRRGARTSLVNPVTLTEKSSCE
jgi:NADPH:quinone reductase-like Zn-dependent oxidoreductase